MITVTAAETTPPCIAVNGHNSHVFTINHCFYRWAGFAICSQSIPLHLPFITVRWSGRTSCLFAPDIYPSPPASPYSAYLVLFIYLFSQNSGLFSCDRGTVLPSAGQSSLDAAQINGGLSGGRHRSPTDQKSPVQERYALPRRDKDFFQPADR